jgi:surface polysaccharide O-acyltransferase-like enzyme
MKARKLIVAAVILLLGAFIVFVSFLPPLLSLLLSALVALPCLGLYIFEYAQTHSLRTTAVEFFKELLFGW